jgi:hypothetical protein
VVEHRVLHIDNEPVADLIVGEAVTLYSVRVELLAIDGASFATLEAALAAARRLLPPLRAAA